MYSFVVGKNWLYAKLSHRAFHQPYMHVVIAFILFITLCVKLPAYSMCWPISGCNISCCRLFRRRVRCHRSLSFTQLCPLELMDSLYLPSLPLSSFLDGLKPYYCNKFSFETFDIISVWLKLCYKSSSTMRVSITDPGMTLCIETRLFEVWSL